MKIFDYKVERTKNCIQINIDNWLKVDTNKVQRFTLSGKTPINCITSVLNKNLEGEFDNSIEDGESVLITKVIADIAQYKYYTIEDQKYYNVPVPQVIGTFRNKNYTLDSLSPLFGKIIFEKIEHNNSKILIDKDYSTTIGRVLKTGIYNLNDNSKQLMKVKEGDIVLIRDNVTTEFTIEGHTYHATSEDMVVGIFKSKSDLDLDNMTFINSCILMKKYKPEKILNYSTLVMPDVDLDQLDEVSIDTQDQFEICYIDDNIKLVKQGDIVFVNKHLTNYVYFNNYKYNMVNGTLFLEGKIEKEK